MVIDGILDLFFSLGGGTDLFYFSCACIIIGGIFSVLIRRFKDI